MYGEVLAREYGNPERAKYHRLTVDAYAVQHPGTESPQSTQSVAMHLSRLCLILEFGFKVELANDAMLAIVKNAQSFRWLEPPKSRGFVTVANVHAAVTEADHLRLVHEWAQSAWTAWSDHHGKIRQWLPGELKGSRAGWGRALPSRLDRVPGEICRP